jgi:3-oxoacyl-[acyl-carrier protein] reductase
MVGRHFGRIVNVTSFSGTVGVKEMVLYGAGKGGVHAFTAGLAKEIAATGVTINCVAPGTVDTPRQRARPEAERAERMARAPVGRFAEPEEIGAAVAFLASREAAYITGEILYVDGGRP